MDKLRDYLRDLKPGARARLIAELERGLLRGDDMPGTEMVLQGLRRSIRESGAQTQRIGDPARLFFQPIEPFLVDDSANHNHRARIARVSLEPIWAWIYRDLAAAEATTFADDVNRALLNNDSARCENLAHGFQERIVQRILDAVAAVANDDRARRRLAAQVGTPRVLEDVNALLAILKARDALVSIGARLPGHIKNLADEQLQSVKMPLDTSIGQNRKVFLYALVLVMSRLASPWQLIRIATEVVESDVAARVAETPYAIAVGIVLNEIERMVAELRSDLRSGRGVTVNALL